MVQDIVFHLGDCKTGTTSVQTILSKGAWDSEATLLYPARFNHIPLAKTLTTDSEKPKQASRFKKLRREIRSSDARHVVVSAEHFEFVDPEALDAALRQYMGRERDHIRLIAYVRPHADRLVSTFAERAKKGGFMKDLPDLHARFLQNRGLMYTPRFTKWRQVFGDRFTLRPFVRNRLYKGDVVEDFFGFVLGEGAAKLTQPTDQNESLSVQDIAMMRYMHKIFRNMEADLGDQQRALGWFLSDYLAAVPNPGGTKPRLHKALAEQVAEDYRADAAALDAEFFDGTPMSDALEAAPKKAVAEAQSFAPKDHFDRTELRRLEAMARLLGHVMESDPRHFLWALRPDDQRRDGAPGQISRDNVKRALGMGGLRMEG